MKHILITLFLAMATTAQAGNKCELTGLAIKATEGIKAQGLTRDQAFDILMPGIKNAELVESWLVWVYDSNATTKQWNALCEATE